MALETCPDAETLQRLCQGLLPPELESAISLHIDSCEVCQEAIDQLGIGDDGAAWLGNHQVKQHDSDVLRHRLAQLKDEVAAPASKQNRTYTDLTPWLNSGDSIGRIDGFELLECIGRGGMGVVFRAKDEQLNRTVAIKFLSPSLLADTNAAERFLREARAAAGVNHPHVVTVHAVSQIRDLPYLVMEYVRGQSLAERLSSSAPLPIDLVIKIARQTAAALAAAHDANVVHRDIKPANILLAATSDDVKLTDFGLARSLESTPLTQTGMLLGTPEYIAPEQVQGAPVDHRSDLFSLGSVMYTMCCGVEPFSGTSIMSTLNQVCTKPPRPIQQLNASTPDWLADLISWLHAKNPRERPKSALQVVEAIVQGESGPQQLRQKTKQSPKVVPSINTRANAPKRPKTTHRFLPWIASGLGVIFLIGVAVVATQPGDNTKSESSEVRAPSKPDRKNVPLVENDAEKEDQIVRASTGEQLWRLMDQSDKGVEIMLTSSSTYDLRPSEVEGHDVSITAAPGVTPTLKCTIDSVDPGLSFLDADVRLSGLIVQIDRETNGQNLESEDGEDVGEQPLIRCEGGTFTADHCRFVGDNRSVYLELSECSGTLRNCEMIAGEHAAIHWQPDRGFELTLSDSVVIAGTGVMIEELVGGTLQLNRNTFFGLTTIEITSENTVGGRLDITAKENQIDASEYLISIQDFNDELRLNWRGERNLLPAMLASVFHDDFDDSDADEIETMAEFKQQTGCTDVGSVQQAPAYQQEREELFESLDDSKMRSTDLRLSNTHPSLNSIGADLSKVGPVAE